VCAQVEDLLKKLSLERCRDVKIGNAMAKGISGGQAKRTNIGEATGCAYCVRCGLRIPRPRPAAHLAE
jgi:hypothetical protein